MAEIRTVTATTTESSITFECFYPYVWIRNLGESDVYASCNADIVAGGVDVSLIKSGEVGMIQTQTDTIYVKATTGTTTLECHAQGFAECPFKRAVRGGVIPSITVEPLSVSTNGVYTAPIGKAYSPVTVDVQEQPWQPLQDGYSNFWFELTDDTLSPWLNFSAKNNNAVIDWGDGSGEVALDTLTPTHTYSKAGKYVVKVKGVTGIARQNVEPLSGGYLGALKYIELNSEVLELQNYAFHRCVGLADTAIPNGVTIGTYAFGYTSSLVKCPNITGITSIPTSFMVYALSHSRLTLAEGVAQVGSSSFHTNSSLRYLSLPSTITSIGQTGFGGAASLSEIHIAATTPPTLGTNAFSSLPSDYIIYVPTGTGDTYKAAAGWSAYSDHIAEEGSTLSKAQLRRIAEAEKKSEESEVR